MFRLRTVAAFGAGFAAAYFFDAENGAPRRAAALRRIQGDVMPQARTVVQSAAERAPQLTSLPDAGASAVRRATRRRTAEPETGPATES